MLSDLRLSAQRTSTSAVLQRLLKLQGELGGILDWFHTPLAVLWPVHVDELLYV